MDRRRTIGVRAYARKALTPAAVAGIALAPQLAHADDAAADAASDGPVVHVVQSGDTLNQISQQYDVSVEDIMAANNLSDPNFISPGQELTIPVGGLPTPTVPPPMRCTSGQRSTAWT